jgi:hypothetical protein
MVNIAHNQSAAPDDPAMGEQDDAMCLTQHSDPEAKFDRGRQVHGQAEIGFRLTP